MTFPKGLGGGAPDSPIQPNPNTDFGIIVSAEDEILRWAQAKGFTPGEFPESAALFHSEISEALEQDRAGFDLLEVYFQCKNKECDEYKKAEWPSMPGEPPRDCPTCGKKMSPEGVGPEVADLLIRILHWSAQHQVPLELLVAQKMEYNWSRTRMNGGKKY